jgi:hypothetical protein
MLYHFITCVWCLTTLTTLKRPSMPQEPEAIQPLKTLNLILVKDDLPFRSMSLFWTYIYFAKILTAKKARQMLCMIFKIYYINKWHVW